MLSRIMLIPAVFAVSLLLSSPVKAMQTPAGNPQSAQATINSTTKAIVTAVEAGNVALLRTIVKNNHGLELDTIKDQGKTLLEIAAGKGHIEMVNELLRLCRFLIRDDLIKAVQASLDNKQHKNSKLIAHHIMRHIPGALGQARSTQKPPVANAQPVAPTPVVSAARPLPTPVSKEEVRNQREQEVLRKRQEEIAQQDQERNKKTTQEQKKQSTATPVRPLPTPVAKPAPVVSKVADVAPMQSGSAVSTPVVRPLPMPSVKPADKAALPIIKRDQLDVIRTDASVIPAQLAVNEMAIEPEISLLIKSNTPQAQTAPVIFTNGNAILTNEPSAQEATIEMVIEPEVNLLMRTNTPEVQTAIIESLGQEAQWDVTEPTLQANMTLSPSEITQRPTVVFNPAAVAENDLINAAEDAVKKVRSIPAVKLKPSATKANIATAASLLAPAIAVGTVAAIHNPEVAIQMLSNAGDAAATLVATAAEHAGPIARAMGNGAKALGKAALAYTASAGDKLLGVANKATENTPQ